MEPFILPEETLNQLAQTVSAGLYERHYFENERISGEDLKSFADHDQVNRFLIFQVFQVWEMQLNKLNHPYFNLEQAEIKQTVQTLKNQISRCIEISKEDFQPMLKRAVYNNLKLLLSPRETLEGFFFAQNDALKLTVYERYAQFFSDLDFCVVSILKYHQKNQLDSVEKTVFFEKLDKVVQVFNRKGGKDFEAYRKERFQLLTGRTLEEVMNEARAQAEAQEARKRQEAEVAAAEAQRKAAEEARKRAEEEQRKAAEAQRKAEEEAMRRAEEERKRQSFFDTLAPSADAIIDLDDLMDESERDAQPVTSPVEEPRPEPVAPVVVDVKIEPEPEPEVKEVIVEPPSVVEEVVQNEPPAKVPVPPVSEAPKPEETESKAPTPVAPVTEESTAAFLDRFLSERKKRDTPAESAEKTSTETPAEDKPASVLDRINERPKTIADRFTQNSKPIAESINGNKKIKLDEIPIHKQYQYVQKVFEGNNVRFRIIVDKVNNASNKEEVEDILNKFVLNNDHLDRSDMVVTEFIDLLRNRF